MGFGEVDEFFGRHSVAGQDLGTLTVTEADGVRFEGGDTKVHIRVDEHLTVDRSPIGIASARGQTEDGSSDERAGEGEGFRHGSGGEQGRQESLRAWYPRTGSGVRALSAGSPFSLE